MFDETTEKEDVGYVSDNTPRKPFTFPVSRTIQATVFPYDGKYYFKTREVADLLGIKQPFQFNADIKEMLGKNAVLKGHYTEPFRGAADSKRETFIEGEKLLYILENSSVRFTNNMISTMYVKVVEALRRVYK